MLGKLSKITQVVSSMQNPLFVCFLRVMKLKMINFYCSFSYYEKERNEFNKKPTWHTLGTLLRTFDVCEINVELYEYLERHENNSFNVFRTLYCCKNKIKMIEEKNNRKIRLKWLKNKITDLFVLCPQKWNTIYTENLIKIFLVKSSIEKQ